MTALAHAALDQLSELLGARCLTDADSAERYGVDWTKVWAPAPSAVVLPETAEEVQQIVEIANEHGLHLVPSGGRTGLSAAAVAANGEVVVAFDRMNRVLDFNEYDRAVTVQPGVVTQQLQEFAEQQGLFYPVDFASAGSSQIGGNINTNAGGIKVIRYGMTRDWITGLKVVTGRGELLDLNKGLIKNATGYDLRHLFIGSEGTLGFVVEATVKLARQPRDLTALVLGAPGFREVMKVLHAFQQDIDLTAFEFFSDKAMAHVLEHGVARPFDTDCPFYCLLEFEQLSEQVGERAMEIFEHCVEQGWVLDGVMSQSLGQLEQLWQLRERISESIAPHTPYKNDISVTISKVPDFVEDVDKVVQEAYPDFEIVWFGHIGDGNMHLNILKPTDLTKEEFFQRCGEVSRWVFDIVAKYNGSISAEHGVGMTKKPYLGYSRSEEEIACMKAIKAVFDPNNIMNPGKLFDV
ncbi:MAG: FAD-binding oxidoreductase [Alcanivorax sp.]|nr:FAD-binding oxidoreductase [Alcanivorax sp.]MAY10261.1 FAD-binding oxidoreductase [Alcanivorax sp.]HCE39953.1 FAD-binding oxidoreductase [Alcanivorax sp.]|tara:strand:+ start:62462 stop:63856 length:1395 start_codon:yes stop_codon:yes gene_type:complete